MAYDIGLITMLIVGKCITYTIWVKRLRRELQFRMFAVSGANYSVGQWVQCVISEGAYGGDFRIQTFRKTKMVQEECIVTQDGGVEITTDVRFPVATGCAHSEFFGHVRMRPGVDWPSEGTHKCVIVRTPIDTNMPIPYHTNWMGMSSRRQISTIWNPSSAAPLPRFRTTTRPRRSVVFVDEASDASLWTRDDLGRGHIFVTTKYSAGDRDLLRRGQWISCRFKPYEGPLREVDFEVTSFEECRED
ncbi:hypothetical protein L596_013551 [Steinernema carpocapsae]|uniref:Uncharacterized protein n=1 Tax=Steinernema carpocapsae TaxID=34508 RepID=A0A4U5P160_STECR|nr:hypothetical protein L596_013551 [Steinernema carpocapsae]